MNLDVSPSTLLLPHYPPAQTNSNPPTAPSLPWVRRSAAVRAVTQPPQPDIQTANTPARRCCLDAEDQMPEEAP